MKHVYFYFVLQLVALFIGSSITVSAQHCSTTISAPKTILCANDPIRLSGNASFDVTDWTWYREGTASPVGQSQHLDITVAGKYSVVATGAACQAVVSDTVEIATGVMMQSSGLMQGATEVCAGSTITYTIPPVLHAESYVWNVPHDWAIQSGQGSNTIEVTAGWAAGNVEVQASNACGTLSQSLEVKTTAGIAHNSIGISGTRCIGMPVGNITGKTPTICSGGYFTYQWESSTDQENFSPIPGATDREFEPEKLYNTTWFRRKVTTATTAYFSNVVEITIIPVPAPPLIDDETIFFGQEATLQIKSPSAVNLYYWYDNAGNMVGKGAFLKTGPLTATTVFYAAAVAPCESDRSRVQVTVLSREAAPVAANDTICAGSSAILTVKQPNPAFTYSWYATAEGGAPLAVGVRFTTPLLTQNATYYVAADTGEGVTTRTPVSAVVLPPLTNNTITGNQYICAGQAPIELTGSVPEGGNGQYTYSWEMSVDGVSGFVPVTGDSNSRHYNPGGLYRQTWYRRVVKSEPTGCEVISNVIAVNVMAPISNNELLPPPPACAGTTTQQLTGSHPAGGNGLYTYEWQIETNDGHFVPLADGSRQDYHPHQLEKTTRFRRLVYSGSCVSVSQPVDVVVNQPPAKPVILRNNLELTSSVSGSSYEWRHNGELLGHTAQTIPIQASGFYQMRVFNAQGCYAYSDSLEVLLQPTSLPARKANETITLVPNPAAHGKVKLLLPATWNKTDILITDAAGKTVYRKYFEVLPNEQILQLNSLPAGTYLVLIQAATRQTRQKLVVTR